jgi:hypothetical protein
MDRTGKDVAEAVANKEGQDSRAMKIDWCVENEPMNPTIFVCLARRRIAICASKPLSV